MVETAPVDNEEFERLVELMKSRMDLVDPFPKDFKLKLFSAGKQGKFGDNTEPKPGMLKIKEKMKWQAWMDRKGQDQEECKREFLELAKQVLATDKK